MSGTPELGQKGDENTIGLMGLCFGLNQKHLSKQKGPGGVGAELGGDTKRAKSVWLG